MPERDFVHVLALPNNRFGDGGRESIWKHVNNNRNCTIESIALDLNFEVPYVRKRVDSMVADLKLFPTDFNEDHFQKQSSIKAVQNILEHTSPSVVARVLLQRGITAFGLNREQCQ
jgi:hypothetical protein